MKAVLGLLLGLVCLSRADIPSRPREIPSPPPLTQAPTPPWRDEDAIKAWIVLTVQYTPPVGGKITVLRHKNPHHAANDKIGELWVVPALVKVEMSDNDKDYEMVFCVFHVDTGVSEVLVSFGIPDDQVQKYLHEGSSDSQGI